MANPYFEPAWESLQTYRCPDWFRDAKFGIYLHWGAYSVVEQGRIDVTPIITHRFALEDYGDAFLTCWDQGESGAVKVSRISSPSDCAIRRNPSGSNPGSTAAASPVLRQPMR